MFNLSKLTRREYGIIVYSDNTVRAIPWTDCGDDEIPALFINTPLPWHIKCTHFESYETKDCREALPGTVEVIDGEVVVKGMHIDYDLAGDLARFLLSEDETISYEGKVFDFEDEDDSRHNFCVILPDEWY